MFDPCILKRRVCYGWRDMRVVLRVLLLIGLCILAYGSLEISAREIEVALDADGSILEENRLLEAVADAKYGETRVFSSDAMANEAESAARIRKNDVPTDLQEDTNIVTVLTTFQRELEAVEQMMKLQEKKLQVLQELRRAWLQEQKEVKIEASGDMTRRKRSVDVADIIERKLDAAIAESLADSTARNFDTYFVERASIQLEEEVADMKMMKMKTGSAGELIAVAYRSGVVIFYTSGMKELLRVDTLKQGIKQIALESQEGQRYLVVTYESPVVMIYELNILETSSDSAEIGISGQETKMDHPSMFTISVGPEFTLSVSKYRVLELSAKASAIAIARSSSQMVVAIAQIDGAINFLSLNGTSLRQVQTKSSISVMETRRNLLAFSNTTDIIVSSMTRAQGSVFHTCPGSSAGVSSIAFDAMQPGIMYAGTEQGDILEYAVNVGAPAEAQACRLLSRSTVTRPSRDMSSVMLITTKRYIIAASYQGITVFNVSKTQRNGASLSELCSTRLNKPINPTKGPRVAFSEGNMGSHLAFINDQGTFSLFHCLLPEERETSESQWTIFLYAGFVIAAVVCSQLFLRWQRQPNANPWDSIGKTTDSYCGKYDDLKDYDNASELDGEDFGRYNSLSDELRRKINQAKKGSACGAVDDDNADY